MLEQVQYRNEMILVEGVIWVLMIILAGLIPFLITRSQPIFKEGRPLSEMTFVSAGIFVILALTLGRKYTEQKETVLHALVHPLVWGSEHARCHTRPIEVGARLHPETVKKLRQEGSTLTVYVTSHSIFQHEGHPAFTVEGDCPTSEYLVDEYYQLLGGGILVYPERVDGKWQCVGNKLKRMQ